MADGETEHTLSSTMEKEDIGAITQAQNMVAAAIDGKIMTIIEIGIMKVGMVVKLGIIDHLHKIVTGMIRLAILQTNAINNQQSIIDFIFPKKLTQPTFYT